MKSKLLYHVKEYFSDGSLQEIKIWQVLGSKDKLHGLKYSLVYIIGGERIIGYDNAEGKGDHKHYREKECPYSFEGIEKLWEDFQRDIGLYKGGKL